MLKELLNSESFKSGAILALTSSLLLLVAYISSFAQGRVLGVSFATSNFSSYVEHGGEFLIQTIQSLYTFPFLYEYLNIEIGPLLLALFLTFFLILLNRYKKNINFIFKNEVISLVTFCILISIFYTTVSIQKDFFRISSILQPTTTSEIKKLYTAKNNGFTYEASKDKYKEEVEIYYRNKFSECESIKNIKCLFNINNSGIDLAKKTYISLIQISAFFMIWAFLIKKYIVSFSNKYKQGLYLFFTFNFFSIPYAHGVIGVDYVYPVVNITVKEGSSKVKEYKGVIYLSNLSEKLYFLDRKNFMSIIIINKSKFSSIKQLTKVPIFYNCSQYVKKVELCEERFW